MPGTAFTSAARRAMHGAMRLLAARLARRRVALAPAGEAGPAPMPTLHPPVAGNDNPLAALQTEVERDLRARGYLR